MTVWRQLGAYKTWGNIAGEHHHDWARTPEAMLVATRQRISIDI